MEKQIQCGERQHELRGRRECWELLLDDCLEIRSWTMLLHHHHHRSEGTDLQREIGRGDSCLAIYDGSS
jgi:hypothetical protein